MGILADSIARGGQATHTRGAPSPHTTDASLVRFRRNPGMVNCKSASNVVADRKSRAHRTMIGFPDAIAPTSFVSGIPRPVAIGLPLES